MANAELPQEKKYRSVWTDMRALQMLMDVQREVQELHKANRRLGKALVAIAVIAGLAMTGLGVALVALYNQVQVLAPSPDAGASDTEQ